MKPIVLVGTLVTILLLVLLASGYITSRQAQTSNITSSVTPGSTTSSLSSSESKTSAASSSSVSTTRTSSTSTTKATQTVAITIVKVAIIRGAGSNTSAAGYSPAVAIVIIGVNNTVTWRNNDTVLHTVSSGTEGFDSSMDLGPGESYSFTFATPGTYIYSCAYHGWMYGTVIVKGTP